jgi:hypothetical protein
VGFVYEAPAARRARRYLLPQGLIASFSLL